MQFDISFLIGIAIAPGVVILGILLWKWLAVTNPESHEVLQLRFGRLHDRHTEAGLADGTRLLPWDRWIVASTQWDERVFRAVETNDSQGTMVKVDLRVMFRVSDANRALFEVHDWEEALESTTVHEASAALAGQERTRFLRSDRELASALTAQVRTNMAAYGIEVRDVRILNVEFRPEVARQMFEAVAARLEVAKGEYEERGRTDAALRLARTEEHVAELEARAKAENLKAVGRAYQELRARPEIFEAYTELYRLSQLDPTRVVSFAGFDEGELSRASIVESDLERTIEPARAPVRNGVPTPGR